MALLSNLLPANVSGVEVTRIGPRNAYVDSHQTNQRFAVIDGVLVYYPNTNSIIMGNICPGRDKTLALVFDPETITWGPKCVYAFSAFKGLIDSSVLRKEDNTIRLNRAEIEPDPEAPVTFVKVLEGLRSRGIVEISDGQYL